ncbi:hypothetical protein HDU97_000862 [Phlyctochytrium planicorne]|nr:hypothetical protein HDU97_000862 [Phlyctochytrium planicorne]
MTTVAAFIKTSVVKLDTMDTIELAQVLLALLFAWLEFLVFFNAIGNEKEYWLEVVKSRRRIASGTDVESQRDANTSTTEDAGTGGSGSGDSGAMVVDETTPLLANIIASTTSRTPSPELKSRQEEAFAPRATTPDIKPAPTSTSPQDAIEEDPTTLRASTETKSSGPEPAPPKATESPPTPPPEPQENENALQFYLPDPMSSSSVILDPETLNNSAAPTFIERTFTPSAALAIPPISVPMTVGSAPLLSPIAMVVGDGDMIRSYESLGVAGVVASPEVAPGIAVGELRRTLMEEAFFGGGGEAVEIFSGTEVTTTPLGGTVQLDGLKAVVDFSPKIVTPVSPLSEPKKGFHIHGGGVWDAVWKMWNAEYDGAEEILRNGGRHRVLPRYALHLAEMSMLIEVGTGREEDKMRVLEHARAAEGVCARILESRDEFDTAFSTFLSLSEQDRPKSPLTSEQDAYWAKLFRFDTEICHADALLLYGAFQIMTGKEIKGAFNLRKAWKLYTKLAGEVAKMNGKKEAQPLALCVGFGVALFQLMMSIVPPTFSSVLKAIGFTVDREAGIKTLINVFRSRCVRAPMAAMVVLVDAAFTPFGLLRVPGWSERPRFKNGRGAAVDEDDEDEGGAYVEDKGEVEEWKRIGRGAEVRKVSDTVWPNGTFVRLMSSHLSRRLGAVDDAILSLHIALDGITPRSAFPAGLLFELGILKALKCEWDEARQIFERLWSVDPVLAATNSNSRGAPHPRRGGYLPSKHGPLARSRWPPDADAFEMRPIAGLMMVGCMRASVKGGDAATRSREKVRCLDVAKLVRAEIAGGVAGSGGGVKVKKTRPIKLSMGLLDWIIRRASVHPLLAHCVLYLKRDYAHLAMDGGVESLRRVLDDVRELTLMENATNRREGCEDGDGRGVVGLIEGTIGKYIGMMGGGGGIDARERLVGCLREAVTDVVWVVPHAGYEVAEWEAISGGLGGWGRAKEYLEMCLGKSAVVVVEGGDGEGEEVSEVPKEPPYAAIPPSEEEGGERRREGSAGISLSQGISTVVGIPNRIGAMLWGTVASPSGREGEAGEEGGSKERSIVRKASITTVTLLSMGKQVGGDGKKQRFDDEEDEEDGVMPSGAAPPTPLTERRLPSFARATREEPAPVATRERDAQRSGSKPGVVRSVGRYERFAMRDFWRRRCMVALEQAVREVERLKNVGESGENGSPFLKVGGTSSRTVGKAGDGEWLEIAGPEAEEESESEVTEETEITVGSAEDGGEMG